MKFAKLPIFLEKNPCGTVFQGLAYVARAFCALFAVLSGLGIAPVALASNALFTLRGAPSATAGLYQVKESQVAQANGKKELLAPLRTIKGGESVVLAPGRYLLTNHCSAYYFDHTKVPTEVAFSEVELALRKDVLKETGEKRLPEIDFLRVSCFDTIEDKEVDVAEPRDRIFMLPGEHWIRIGGALSKRMFPITEEKTRIELFPLSVGFLGETPPTNLFYFPEAEENSASPRLWQVPVGATAWLVPGVYVLEINGSRRKARVEANFRTEVFLGALRVATPPMFQEAQRVKKGGQPIFAYTNNGVLLNLNKDYLLFPGEYPVRIEGSEVAETVEVKANESTLVQTRGAQIDPPDCPPPRGCRSPLRITIHKEQRPFTLLTVPVGIPFLVLGGEYEYGVDGLRGVLRKMNGSQESVTSEKLGRILLKWEVRQANSRIRTDLVRIEAKGSSNFGRSLDLMYNKPDEIYLPSGEYILSYFVGDPQQERVKTKIDFIMKEGATRELVVPIFMDKALVKDASSARKPGFGANKQSPSKAKEGANSVEELPQTLAPIRK